MPPFFTATAGTASSSGSTAPRDLPNRPPLDSESVRQARIDLAACFRMAARLGLHEGICNHFSAMLPGYDDLFLVNAYGYAFSEVTASNLLVCDFDGNVVAGDGAPEATAFYIHGRLHKALPRARVALHTHMPYATALSRSEEHTSELQSLMRISYAVFCLQKKNQLISNI